MRTLTILIVLFAAGNPVFAQNKAFDYPAYDNVHYHPSFNPMLRKTSALALIDNTATAPGNTIWNYNNKINLPLHKIGRDNNFNNVLPFDPRHNQFMNISKYGLFLLPTTPLEKLSSEK
jgi:hypothetical protein